MKHQIKLDGIEYTLDVDAAKEAGILTETPKHKTLLDVKVGDVVTYNEVQNTLAKHCYIYLVVLEVFVNELKVLNVDCSVSWVATIKKTAVPVTFLTLGKNGFRVAKEV